MLRRSAGELEWREGAALGVVALAALLAMDAYVRDSPTPQNDELIYDRMASDPFDPHTFPFAYRVAVPLAARFLPFSRELSFSLLMRPFPIPKRLAAGIGLGLALCPTLFVVSLRQGFSADPESVFVMLASAPGLAAYAALRLSIPTVARDQVLGYDSLLGGRLDVLRAAADDPQYPLRRVALAFGPLWLAAPFALRDLRYAIYMEDFGGAQEGIIDVSPAPYEIR